MNLELFKARDATNGYALRKAGDPQDVFLTQTGFGSAFDKVWSVEFHSSSEPPLAHIDWEAVLQRVIEAYEMSDPIIENFDWARVIV